MYVCITFISDSAIQNNIPVVIQCWGSLYSVRICSVKRRPAQYREEEELTHTCTHVPSSSITQDNLLLLAYVSQISRPVEASQALVSSSRLTIPSLPDGGRCCGQTSKMWSTVCSGAPHSQTEESLRPHFSMDELNRPTPVQRRLRVVHCFRDNSP